MSNNQIVLTGMSELRAALRQLPDHLVAEATGIVSARAEAMASKVVAAYPTVSGKLKQGVKVQAETSRGGVSYRVRSIAKHAHLYEYGTQTRQDSLGRNRGSMPAANVFVPAAVRERREMVQQLIAMVRKEGLVVSG